MNTRSCMAKRNFKNAQLTHGDRGVSSTEFTEDDDLLPTADELAKYNQIDPDFINWIKTRCDAEQNGRIGFNNKRIELASNHDKRIFTLEYTALISSIGVILTLACMSFCLIQQGHILWGSIFGGTTSVVILKKAFSSRKEPEEKRK